MAWFVRHILHRLMLALLVSASITLCGCEEGPTAKLPAPQIIFMFSPGGLGDMSYNDLILKGLQQFRMKHPDVRIFMSSPKSIADVEQAFAEWIGSPQIDSPSLFVLASNDYEAIVDRCLASQTLSANKQILLFESGKEYGVGVSTFQISMYGASYLAGVSASQLASKPIVLLANMNDKPIVVARDGFMAGYGTASDLEYLAEDWTGYISANSVYQKMHSWSACYDYIFPVCGGSNAGLYRYSRESLDCPYLVGMDVDQSSLSDKITGSVVKHIDRVTYQYLSQWLATKQLPSHALYGLESGYVDWLPSPKYTEDPFAVTNQHRIDAISKEKEYHEMD